MTLVQQNPLAAALVTLLSATTGCKESPSPSSGPPVDPLSSMLRSLGAAAVAAATASPSTSEQRQSDSDTDSPPPTARRPRAARRRAPASAAAAAGGRAQQSDQLAGLAASIADLISALRDQGKGDIDPGAVVGNPAVVLTLVGGANGKKLRAILDKIGGFNLLIVGPSVKPDERLEHEILVEDLARNGARLMWCVLQCLPLTSGGAATAAALAAATAAAPGETSFHKSVTKWRLARNYVALKATLKAELLRRCANPTAGSNKGLAELLKIILGGKLYAHWQDRRADRVRRIRALRMAAAAVQQGGEQQAAGLLEEASRLEQTPLVETLGGDGDGEGGEGEDDEQRRALDERLRARLQSLDWSNLLDASVVSPERLQEYAASKRSLGGSTFKKVKSGLNCIAMCLGYIYHTNATCPEMQRFGYWAVARENGFTRRIERFVDGRFVGAGGQQAAEAEAEAEADSRYTSLFPVSPFSTEGFDALRDIIKKAPGKWKENARDAHHCDTLHARDMPAMTASIFAHVAGELGRGELVASPLKALTLLLQYTMLQSYLNLLQLTGCRPNEALSQDFAFSYSFYLYLDKVGGGTWARAPLSFLATREGSFLRDAIWSGNAPIIMNRAFSKKLERGADGTLNVYQDVLQWNWPVPALSLAAHHINAFRVAFARWG
jgi:hypothetical protein